MSPEADRIMATLAGYRLELADEMILQGQIAQVFTVEGIDFVREARLGPGERIDFLCGAVGVEVKVKGGPSEISRQCARYCATGRILELVLVTSRAVGLPREAHGVPCRELSLAGAWL